MNTLYKTLFLLGLLCLTMTKCPAQNFSKISSGPVTNTPGDSRSVNWVDVNNDNYPDLMISNGPAGGQNNFLFINDAVLNDGRKTMSSSWADFDNDGDLDVFLANENSTNGLFRNDGNFVFTKLTGDTVSKTSANSFSSAWSDVDNDGDLDLFVTNAFKTNTKLPCFFYLNNGNSTFTRQSGHTLTSDSAWTYGCAFGDYDNDGFEDLAVATCRYQNVDAPDYLYHNNGNSNHWITIKLIGSSTNKGVSHFFWGVN